MALRRTLVSWHRWLGLAFAVLLFSQGLTGAAIVFRDELNVAIHRDALRVVPTPAPRSLQSLSDMVRSAYPQLQIERIQYPKHDDEAFLFRLEAAGGQEQRYVAVDPYKGAITRDAPLAGWPVEWLFRLHHQLLLGADGEVPVGVVGVALLCIVLIAPFLWWPGRRNLRRGFEITLDKGTYRSLRDLHRVGGIVIVAVLLVSATTGIVMVWKTEIQSVLERVLPVMHKPSPTVAQRTDAALLPLDDIVAAVRARHGNARIKSVRFPGGHGRVALVILDVSAGTRPRGSDQIWLDGYTGETLGMYEAAKLPAGNQFTDWMLPIHSGEALGLPGRVLFLLTAFALQALAITGVLQWLTRRQLRRAVTSQ